MSTETVVREPEAGQEFLTVAELAKLLRCHPRTVLNRIRQGVVQAFRIDGTRRWLVPTGEYYRVKSELLRGAWE